jgi:anti-sigma B factor antagonist
MPAAPRLIIQPIRDVTLVTLQDASILDTVQVEQLGEQLFDLVENRDRRKLVIDFSNVKFLSSSALGVLIRLHKRVAQSKGDLILCSMRDDLKKVFRISGLHKVFTFADDSDRAMTRLGVIMA